jgi:hypothetical protein
MEHREQFWRERKGKRVGGGAPCLRAKEAQASGKMRQVIPVLIRKGKRLSR